MGAVKSDIKKNEYQFRNIPFSDPNAINALIRFRSKIDLYFTYDSEHVENLTNVCILNAEKIYQKEIKLRKTIEDKFSVSDINVVNQELIGVYVSLDNLIKDVSLSEQQEIILNLFMVGFNATEIGLYMKKKTQQINNILVNISIKITNEYKKQWKYSLTDQDIIKVKWKYKICNRCNTNKPLTKDFYRVRSDEKGDGYYNICRKCEK